jgi:hypothetical protein
MPFSLDIKGRSPEIWESRNGSAQRCLTSDGVAELAVAGGLSGQSRRVEVFCLPPLSMNVVSAPTAISVIELLGTHR